MASGRTQRVVLVTGCRTGIGAAAVKALAAAGHVVYAGLRDPAAPRSGAEDWDRLGVTALPLDVTDDAQRRAAVERILSERGRIDVLVNNAGVAVGGFLEQLEEDELRRVYEVNVFGTWAMTKQVLPAMREAGSGLILQVSSMAGRQALPGFGAYASSKFALEGMSESWRHELRRFGVRCVLLEPGAYRTEIFDPARLECRGFRDPDSPYAEDAAALARTVRSFVERRGRDPIEVAEKIVALVESRAPGLRHPVGPGVWLRSLMLRFLPFGLVELLLAKAMERARRAERPTTGR
jgi:NAD(P)-dependent dehydrogenase (short-subunit alcohol dehydrogenase family)